MIMGQWTKTVLDRKGTIQAKSSSRMYLFTSYSNVNKGRDTNRQKVHPIRSKGWNSSCQVLRFPLWKNMPIPQSGNSRPLLLSWGSQ